jgi:hypothetical protein
VKDEKIKKLAEAGWKVGSADEFLELSEDESRRVTEGAAQEPSYLLAFRIPEGWTLELLPRQPDHVLLNTPLPRRYMATIDFHARGIRTGYSTTGMFVGEEWNKRRKKYGGRGWKQTLVNDAVAHLQEVLR